MLTNVDEWEDLRMCDDVYYITRHKPCGSEVQILMGHQRACPKCHPEEWAKLRGEKC